MTVVASFLLGFPAVAEDHGTYMLGDITVAEPWSRASSEIARAGGAYLTITNAGPTDTLIAGETDSAQRVELHNHTMTDGVMMMHEVEGGIAIGAGETVSLAPGGLHVMMMGLTEQLVEGESFPLTLTFEHAGSIEVEVMIRDVAAGGPVD